MDREFQLAFEEEFDKLSQLVVGFQKVLDLALASIFPSLLAPQQGPPVMDVSNHCNSLASQLSTEFKSKSLTNG